MGALHFPSLRKRREITAQIEVQELEKKQPRSTDLENIQRSRTENYRVRNRGYKIKEVAYWEGQAS
jgi:hypothetical protein